ncbi:MAG: GHKL domain-containing protein [Anaerolineae bacterium]|nr:GHKL domain-containing protein [Anaerolineae bacterium]
MQGQLPTLFAPAERIAPDQIAVIAPAVQAALDLQPLLDAVPNVLLVLNRYRQILYSNQALLDVLGIDDPSQIYGLRPGEVLQCTHSFETEGGCGTAEACSTCGAVQAILMGLSGKAAVKECRIMTHAGASLDLRVWAKPLTVRGEPCTIFAIADISDEKRRDILERIFLHDIRNTASLVVSYADLMQMMDSLSEEERTQLLSQLTMVASHLIRDIDTQRIITAAECNTLTPTPVGIDAQQVLMDARSEYGQYEIDHHLTIHVRTTPNAIRFTSDRSLIERVVDNMLKNALEASAPGDIVTLRAVSDAETVTFEVHNMTYMPRKVQLQIFQRSYSTKGVGRGLGTYSIKLLSENYLHGRVWFESSEDHGTSFFAQYPLNPTETANAQ